MSEVNGTHAAPLLPAGLHRVACGDRVYLIRTPRLLDRAALTREVVSMGGSQHSPQALLRAMLDGIRATPEGFADRARIIAAIEAHLDRWQAFGQAVTEDDRDGAATIRAKAILAEIDLAGRELDPVERVLRQHWQPYAEMVGDNAAWPLIHAIACARLFLAGWEGVETPFPPLGPDRRVPDDVLALIPEGDLDAIARAVVALLNPVPEQEKNSPSRPSGRPGRRTSSANRPGT